MGDFAQYYVDFLWYLLQNIWAFISSIGKAFYKFFIQDIGFYFKQLGNALGTFDWMAWIVLILIVAINSTFIFFLGYRLVQLIRRYIIFRGEAVEKDKLVEEIARLREQADQLVKEKSQIFALKLNVDTSEELASSAQDLLPAGQEEQVDAGESRFTKLINLDEKYAREPNIVFMEDSDMLNLEEIVERFVNFAASQLKLYYPKETIRLWFAGLATSHLLILEGISGTGKTSLPYAMGKFFKNETAICSVQPSWRDRAELIGYFNEFTKKFNETDFLARVYECTYRDDPNFVVLDEMNIARIEYYFADFLSIMEMPDYSEWKVDIVAAPSPSDPANIVYGKLLIPQNVWFVGTANNDDSTFTITDKVYDRAITLEINQKANYFDAPITEALNCTQTYLAQLFDQAHQEYSISEENKEKIKLLDNFIMQKFKVTFGNRIMKQLRLFVPAYMACGGTEIGGIDFIVCSKILHKFKALNLPFLTKELSELSTFLDKTFGKGEMSKCLEYIKELQKMS
ncbi:MAG: hypothetical protein J1F36_02175 [Clostridiales bacterium]|nr:hypothetical protein [Clostridiales bacterium]